MSPATHVMLNCFLTMGLPVLWGLYELWALGRARSDGDDRRVGPAPTPPKPLPECLIPKPLLRDTPLGDPAIPAAMRRERVLEDA